MAKEWLIIKATTQRPEYVQACLKDGYEPFAVTPDSIFHTIWFKKEVSNEEASKLKGIETPKNISPGIYLKGGTDEPRG